MPKQKFDNSNVTPEFYAAIQTVLDFLESITEGPMEASSVLTACLVMLNHMHGEQTQSDFAEQVRKNVINTKVVTSATRTLQ